MSVRVHEGDAPRVRAAIIGCGRIASGYDGTLDDANVYSHAKAYLLNPHVDLVAACDVAADQRAAFARKWGGQISLFDTPRALLAGVNGLDLVSICTPTPSHYSDLLSVLDTDIPYVLCEKPLVDSLDRVDDVIERYEARNKTLLVNHALRWEPGILQLKARVESDPSSVQAVHAVYAKGLQHNGIHIVDLTLFLFGEPTHIRKISEFEEVPGDPTCSFVLTYPRFSVYITGLAEKHYSVFEYTVYLADDKIVMTDLTTRIVRYPAEPHPFLAGYTSLSSVGKPWPCRQTRNMSNVIDDVVEGIRSQKRSLFRCGPAEARATMACLQRISASPCLPD